MSRTDYKPKTPRPKCLYCGKPMPLADFVEHRIKHGESEWGYQGNGIFCTLRCGYRYGLVIAKAKAKLEAEKGG